MNLPDCFGELEGYLGYSQSLKNQQFRHPSAHGNKPYYRSWH